MLDKASTLFYKTAFLRCVQLCHVTWRLFPLIGLKKRYNTPTHCRQYKGAGSGVPRPRQCGLAGDPSNGMELKAPGGCRRPITPTAP